jgi:hypothetical protein
MNADENQGELVHSEPTGKIIQGAPLLNFGKPKLCFRRVELRDPPEQGIE